jgi:hypothetical protein
MIWQFTSTRIKMSNSFDDWLLPPEQKQRSKIGAKQKRQTCSLIIETDYRPSPLKILENFDKQTLIVEITRLQTAIQQIARELGLEPSESGFTGFDFQAVAKVMELMRKLARKNPR